MQNYYLECATWYHLTTTRNINNIMIYKIGLTHWSLVTHINISELSCHWFRYGLSLVWCQAIASMNSEWILTYVNWTPWSKFEGSFNQYINNSFDGNALNNVQASIYHSNVNEQWSIVCPFNIRNSIHVATPLYSLFPANFPQWVHQCLIICHWAMEWTETSCPINGNPGLYFNITSGAPKKTQNLSSAGTSNYIPQIPNFILNWLYKNVVTWLQDRLSQSLWIMPIARILQKYIYLFL